MLEKIINWKKDKINIVGHEEEAAKTVIEMYAGDEVPDVWEDMWLPLKEQTLSIWKQHCSFTLAAGWNPLIKMHWLLPFSRFNNNRF